MRYISLLILCLISFIAVDAQTPGNLDKIVAIVGERIVLKSEIELALIDYKQQNPNIPATAKCDVLEQILGQKILAEQADRDSIIVSDDEVEGTLENRIRYFVQYYGSEEKLEATSGKTVYQLKDEYRPVFKEQLLAERMQQQIMSVVKITPQEVNDFYKTIPTDSLPYYPSTVEVGQIILAPRISKEVDNYAKEKLANIRKDLKTGVADFATQAGIYSEDPGTRNNGGDLGLVERSGLVKEFAAAAFRLQKDEISDIVKTEFGYHIIKMVSRQGQKARLSHILIKPQVTSVDIKRTVDLGDSLRAELMAKKLTFNKAVDKFSSDKRSKLTGGMVASRQTGSTILSTDELDPATAIAVQELEVGQYSKPQEYVTETGDKTVRILYLKSRTEPHKANLKEDYYRIQQVALSQKQNKYLMTWLEQHIPTFYIMIDKDYQDCDNAKKWMSKN